MPIVARQAERGAPVAPRSGSDGSDDGAGPLEDLLPSGGVAGFSPALAPHRMLALDAVLVMRTLRDHPRDADPWGEPAFAREVELVRQQLAPIRSRRALAASFEREAFQTAAIDEPADAPAQAPPEPVVLRALRVAYALRWLELGDGIIRRGWTSLVAGRA